MTMGYCDKMPVGRLELASPQGWPIFPTGICNRVKDTLRATVRMGYDGRVHKTFRGPDAEKRFANEVRVLKYLETRGCPFVPKLLEDYPDRSPSSQPAAAPASITSTRRGRRSCSPNSCPMACASEDAEMRNVTYRQSDGRFCLIDFEFATILDDPPHAGNNERTIATGQPEVVGADGPRPGADQ